MEFSKVMSGIRDVAKEKSLKEAFLQQKYTVSHKLMVFPHIHFLTILPFFVQQLENYIRVLKML